MTTFQDPPPQSRRAVRQSERGETPEQTSNSPQPYSFDPAANPASTAASAPAAPQSGRRAQSTPADAPQAGFEPLTYVTQGRAPVQDDAQPPLEHRQAPPATEPHAQQSLAQQPPPTAADQPAYRVRDYSPEGRRAAITREQHHDLTQAPPPIVEQPMVGQPVGQPTGGQPALAPQPAPQAQPAPLDYHTQGAAPSRSHAAAAPTAEDSLDHTLTRRELRELRATQEADAPQLQLPEPIDTLLNSGPISLPTLAPPPGQSQALADAMAEFDLLTRARREAEARARDDQVASLTPAPVPTQVPPVQAEAPAQALPAQAEAPAQASAPTPPPLVQPSAPQPSAPQAAAPEQAAPQAAAPAPVTPPSVASAPTPEALPWAPPPPPSAQSVPQPPPAAVEPVFIEPERTPASRPTGHWSVQAEMDDDELPFENTLSRTVGSGTSAITTSALVLPSVPQASDLNHAYSSTGEILVTGSIDLPRSLGTTGALPHRVDNSDFEDDPLDSQVASPDSAPVRAIRAVSTHTSTRGVIESKRPQSNRVLSAIIITASVLVVAVVGLLVYAVVSGQI